MKNVILISKWASAVLVALCFIVPVGCDDDPVSPPPSGPPDYHVYYDYVDDSARQEFMPIYSTRTMESVDTFDGAYRDFLFTPDGKYIVANDAEHSEILLIDVATRNVIVTDTGARIFSLSLSENGKYLLAGKEMNAYGLTVYAMEGLTRMWRDTIPGRQAEFISQENRFVYTEWQSDTFYVVDFVNAPNDRVKLHGGSGFYPTTMSLDTASDKLYVIGQSKTGSTFLRIYDGSDLSVIKTIRIPENFVSAPITFTSDGLYAYLAAPFPAADFPPGVLRYDARNESLEWFIDATRFFAPILAPQDIRLTPDGAILCVLSQSTSGVNPGDLFMFSTQTGELVKGFYHKGGQGRRVRVFPLAR